MKKTLLLCGVLVFLLAFSSWAAMTNSLDKKMTADSWSNAVDSGRANATFWGREVETILEGWTLADDTSDILTFPVNGGTISNATDNAFIFGENSETLRLTFATTKVTASSASGVTHFDFGTMQLEADHILLDPLAAYPTIAEGRLYYDDTNDVLTYRNNSAWVTCPGTSTAGGTDTQLQWNNGGTTLGGLSGLIYDDTNIEVADEQGFAWGTDGDWVVTYDENIDNQLLWETVNTSAAATTDPMWEILIDSDTAQGSGVTADQQLFGIAIGTQSDNAYRFTVDAEGDGVFAGSLTVGTSFYQAAIAAAASGNVALNLDGAGTGTVGINQTGSGNITLYRATTCSSTLAVTTNLTVNGNTDIGNAASDTITITGKIDGNLNIDDDTGDSPSLTFTDGTGETVIFAKTDTGLLTITSSATGSDDGVQITGGSLRVGNGSNGVTLDGEDFYCEGTSEFDGAMQIDGAVVMNSTLEINGVITLENDETIDNADNGEITFGDGSDDTALSWSGTTLQWTTDTSVDTVAWGDLDAHTGLSSVAFDAAASTITLAAGGDTQDLTMQVTGAHDSSLIFQNTGGTGADAISLLCDGAGGGITIDTDNGAISIVADNSTAGDITIDAEDTITIVSTDDGVGGIYLHLNGGTSETLKIHSDLGEAATSVHILSDAGGITVDAGADDAITLIPGTIITCSTTVIADYMTETEDQTAAHAVLATDSGSVFTNQSDTDSLTYTLPAAAIGLTFTFCDIEFDAGEDLCILAVGDDTINKGTAAQYYNSYADSVEASVTLVAVSATEWVVVAEKGTWTNDADTTAP